MSVRAYVKILLSVAVFLVAYGVMTHAFHLMNLPSDRALYGGSAMLLVVLLALPVVLHLIWRKQSWRK